jgi:predicted NBD/HSP70 family sugar kinase
VFTAERWRHGDDDPRREHVVEWMIETLNHLAKTARKSNIALAPFVGIGCPGRVRLDGFVDRGAQNLPGNWEALRFHLPTEIRKGLDRISGEEPVIVLHNDAVVQGLSEVPRTRDVEHWGVLTIGTGLGNAKFVNR